MKWLSDANNQTMLKIYTDWANHYLEKAGCASVLRDLQRDLCDGVLLARVIESVTCKRIDAVNPNPKNATQMINNINICLCFLQQIGVCIDDVRANDVNEGSLKAILSLFFNLSRYKQLQKSGALGSTASARSNAAESLGGGITPGGGNPGMASCTAVMPLGTTTTTMVAGYTGSNMAMVAPTDSSSANSRTPGSTRSVASRRSPSGTELKRSAIAQKKMPAAAAVGSSGMATVTAPAEKKAGSGSGSNLILPGHGQALSRSTSPASAASSGIPTPSSKASGASRSTSSKSSRLAGPGQAIENSTSTSSFSSSLSSSSRSTSTSSGQKATAVTPAAAAAAAGASPSAQGAGVTGSAISPAATAAAGAGTAAGRSGSALDRMYMARRQQTSAGSSGGRATDADSSGMEGSCENIPARVSEPHGTTDMGSRSGKGASRRATATTASSTGKAPAGSAQRPSKLQMASSAGSTGIPRASSASSRDPSPQSRTPSRENLASTRRAVVAASSAGEQTASSIPRVRSAGGKSKVTGGGEGRTGTQDAIAGGRCDEQVVVDSPSTITGIPRPYSANDDRTQAAASAAATAQRKDSVSEPQMKSIPKALTVKKPRAAAHAEPTRQPGAQQMPLSEPTPPLSGSYSESKSVAASSGSGGTGVGTPYNRLPGLHTYLREDGGYGDGTATDEAAGASAGGRRSTEPPRKCITAAPHTITGPQPVSTRAAASPVVSVQATDPSGRGHVSSTADHADVSAGGRTAPTAAAAQRMTQAVPPSQQQHKSDSITQTEPSALQKIAAQVQKSPSVSNNGEKNMLRKEAGNQTMQPQQQSSTTRAVADQLQHTALVASARPHPDVSASRLLAPKVSTARVATIASMQAKGSPGSAVPAQTGALNNDGSIQEKQPCGVGSSMLGSSHGGTGAQGAATASAIKASERSRVETTFDVKGETETKAFGKSTKETTFDAAATAGTQDDLSPSATVKPMQPLSQLASYEFLQRLEATRSANHALAAVAAAARGSLQHHQQSMAGICSGQPFNRLGLMHRSFTTKSSVRNLRGDNDDCSSDADSYSAGYLSDVADCAAGNHRYDDFSGYLSEGGASMYARKMQQRFREGMMAVEECMSKSSRLLDAGTGIDDDDDDDELGINGGGGTESFDEGSSVSSDDISDAIGDCAAAASVDAAAGSIAAGSQCGNEPVNNELVSGDELSGRERNDVKRLSSYISNSGSALHTYAQKNTNALLAADTRNGGGERLPPMTADKHGGWSVVNGCGSQAVGSTARDCSVSAAPTSARLGSTCGYVSDGGCPYYAPGGGSSLSFVPPPVWASMTPLARQRLVEQQRAKGLISSKTQQSLAASRNHDDLYRSSTLGRSATASASRYNGSSSGCASAAQRMAADGCNEESAATAMELYHAGGSGGQMLHGTRHASLGGPSTSSGYQLPFDYASSLAYTNHQMALVAGRGGSGACAGMQAQSVSSAYMGQQQPPAHMSIHAQIQQARALSNGPSLTSTTSGSSNSQPWSSHCSMPGSTGGGGGVGGGYSTPRSLQLACAAQQQHHQLLPLPQPCLRMQYGSGGNAGLDSSVPSRLSAAGSDESRPSFLRNGVGQPCTAAADCGGQPSTRSSIGSACTSASEEETNYRSSSQSLVSSTSSMFSTAEEKQAAEIRKLRLELERAKDKVMTLTSQLTSNAHVVQAFQQSLTNMTLRLQHLSTASEQKGSEVTELRATIEHLQRMSGLAQADIQKAAAAPPSPAVAAAAADRRFSATSRAGLAAAGNGSLGAFSLTRQLSADSLNSLHSINSASGSASRQQVTAGMSYGGVAGGSVADMAAGGSRTSGSGAVTSDISAAAAAAEGKGKKKKKNNWLRSSFTKAFSRKKSGGGSASDAESDYAAMSKPMASASPGGGSHMSDLSLASAVSAPTSPMHHAYAHLALGTGPQQAPLSPVGPLGEDTLEHYSAVTELKKQLREKELKLTDIRLDALTSAHQLEQLRDAMNKMKNEMSSLKADNERLHRLVGDKAVASGAGGSPTSSTGSPTSAPHCSRAPVFFGQYASPSVLSPTCMDRIPTALVTSLNSKTSSLDFLNHDMLDATDGKRVTVSVASHCDPEAAGTYIGALNVSGKTRWDVLDGQVRKIFKHYLSRIDPSTNLGLTADSIQAFSVGEVLRAKDAHLPELLPYGYLVGSTTNIQVYLKGAEQSSVDGLAFETGIPKSIVQRYVALLLEHRRIVLCGPSGTGKTYLAHRLAEHLVARSNYDAGLVGLNHIGSTVATFNVDNKSCSELKQYLTALREQCESGAASGADGRGAVAAAGSLTACSDHLPAAVIIDNLQACSGNGMSLSSAFAGFLSHKHPNCPYLICTMTQGGNSGTNVGSSTTNLQLHHNFRWVLCANHMEPVKGLLGRCLRRRLVEVEVRQGVHNNDLCKVVDWMPKVWQHINKCLETYGSVETTVGPQLLMMCPMDVAKAQAWFIDLWNHNIVPHLKQTIRSGLQTYGHRTSTNWENPAEWLRQTYPWPEGQDSGKTLLLDVQAAEVGLTLESVEAATSGEEGLDPVLSDEPPLTREPKEQLQYRALCLS